MSTQPICGICSPTGLPFLLLRKSVVATNQSLAPKGAEKLQAHAASSQAMGLPALEHSKYILRLLRESNADKEIQGFLHVFHKVPRLVNGKSKDWQVFRVKTGGALVPVEHPDALAITPFQCTRNPSHPHDVRLYVLPDPLTASDIYFAYSANQWSEKITRRGIRPLAQAEGRRRRIRLLAFATEDAATANLILAVKSRQAFIQGAGKNHPAEMIEPLDHAPRPHCR